MEGLGWGGGEVRGGSWRDGVLELGLGLFGKR